MSTADRDLLFGLLALQNGLIDQVQLVAAFQAWTREKGRPLAEHLVGRGDLDADQRSLLEALVAQHLRVHGGDVERSLGSIPAGRSTRERLEALADPELSATMARLGSGSTEVGEDPDRTVTYAVGATTADGRRFRVLRPHARGGLGAVFVALDEELHREVALKQILDHHADDAVSRQRFLLEAEITGGLEHPGIVPVYGLGTYGDGRPYYAMRFIRGDSLKGAIERFHRDEALKADPGRRSLELLKLLRRFLDVCNAIDYAHGRGVLHRDIKPGNIIVGRHGETLVVDWGLAKAVGRVDVDPNADERPLAPSSASGSAETLPGSAIGTPAYMSPEQARGDLDRLGPRSDVYSLGATLYCLLTGRPPFEGDDLGAVLRAVQQGEFPRPRALDPRIDGALEAICLKAMALKPEDRYPTPRALAEDVERWTADQPVSAWREPAWRRFRRWTRRHRPLVACAAALLAASVVGLIVGTILLGRANARTEQQRRIAEANYRKARQAVDDYFTTVSESTLLDVPGLQPLRKELLDSALKYYRDFLRERGADPSARRDAAAGYFRAASLTRLIGSQEEAVRLYRRSIDLYESLVRERPGEPRFQTDLAIVCDEFGNLLRHHGRADESRRLQDRGLGLREALARAHPENARYQDDLAASLRRIVTLLNEAGRHEEALDPSSRSVAILEALSGLRGPVPEVPSDLARRDFDAARLHANLAWALLEASYAHFGLGRYEDSHASRRRALGIAEALVRDHPKDVDFCNLLATCWGDIGVVVAWSRGPAEGVRAFEQGRALLDRLVAENPTVTAYRKHLAATEMNLGEQLGELGRSGEALGHFERAESILREIAAANPGYTWARSDLATDQMRSARLLASMDRVDEALRRMDEARALLEQLVAADPAVVEFRLQLASIHQQRGYWRARIGRRDEASADLEASRALLQRLVADNPKMTSLRISLADVDSELARVVRDLGRPDEAIGLYGEALAILSGLAHDHPEIVDFRLRLAYVHRGLGRLEAQAGHVAEARRAFDAARALDEPIAEVQLLSRYNLACDLALLLSLDGRGEPASTPPVRVERPGLTEAAIAALRVALAAGYPPAIPRDDPDLDPLRAHPDFRALMMDSAFPADPFAR